MRKLIIAGSMLALAVPAATASATEGGSSAPSASEQCSSLRTALGAKTFGDTYGTNKNRANAFGKCVSAFNKQGNAAKTAANTACKAEQDADAAAFTAKYGSGKKGKNAFGKCVSSKRSTSSTSHKKTVVNAAKACKAERKADPAAFTAKYGTNANKANAFGKCVSAKAKAPATV